MVTVLTVTFYASIDAFGVVGRIVADGARGPLDGIHPDPVAL